MSASDDDSRSSSLPKSLRPHLYTRPLKPLDSSPCLPLPLPPLNSPSHRPSLGPHSRSAVSLLDLRPSDVLQGSPQTHRPIYSDPVFHTSRSQSLSRLPTHSSLHYTLEDTAGGRNSWREGDPGPSTLGPVLRTPRAQTHPAHDANLLSGVRSRDVSPYRGDWVEQDYRSSHPYHRASPLHRERADWGGTHPPQGHQQHSDVVTQPQHMGTAFPRIRRDLEYEQQQSVPLSAPIHGPIPPPSHRACRIHCGGRIN